MTANVDSLVSALLEREGGYVNDPRDSGGETNFGISERVARDNGFVGDMRDMTRDQAASIYKSQYWFRPGFADVAKIWPSVAEELFDTGVNMGVVKAALFLQISLNGLNRGGRDFPDIPEDGAVGPGTMRALRAYRDRRGGSGESVLLKALNCLQGAAYIDLSRRRPKDEDYVFGWLDKRVGLPS